MIWTGGFAFFAFKTSDLRGKLMQPEGLPSQIHRNRSISDLAYFQSLEYLSMYNEVSGEIGPKLNLKFIYVSYIYYTHILRIILYHVFSNSVDKTKFQDMEFSM